jgi:hypothetical protein
LRRRDIHALLAILAECSRSRILSTTKSTINIVSTRVGVFLFPDSTTGNKITNFAEEAGHQHYVELPEDKDT